MRRIIIAFLTVTLTGCDGQQPRSRSDTESGAASDSRADIDARVESAGRSGGSTEAPAAGAAGRDDARTILFVGTSLTAGYGVGADNAYPAVIQQKIDSAGLPYRVVNAGISGETSAGGLRRIEWSLQQPADVLVLELGANDALRGLDPGQMRDNLDAILARARALHPGIAIVIVGMEAPPNLGDDYTRRFRSVFRDLARKYDAALVPFLLEGVAAVPELNIADGMHPNEEGHRVLAAVVWPVLAETLR